MATYSGGRLSLVVVASLIMTPGFAAEAPVLDIGLSLLRPEIAAGKTITQSLMIELTPPAMDRAHAPPKRDLIIVLDTSGSMNEDGKLDKAKQAIASILESSLATDQLHLITYSSSARTRSGLHDTKEDLSTVLASLRAQGGTNMMAGLEEARLRLWHLANKDSLKRVFVFSDGLVNVGVQEPRRLAQAATELLEVGASTNAFGIGTDHDRTLMSALAERGRGQYFFIKGAQEMEKVVAVATEGFRGLFATAAKVSLAPSAGVEVLEALGQAENDSGSLHDVLVGDLYTGEKRRVLVELSVPGNLPQGLVDIMECEVSYLLEPNHELQTSRRRARVQVLPAGSAPAPENPEVSMFRRLQRLLSQEALVEGALEAGRFAEAQDFEQLLESDLGELVKECSGSEVCDRVQSAYSRTVRSNAMLQEKGEMPEMQKHAYAFKRRLNALSYANMDEL